VPGQILYKTIIFQMVAAWLIAQPRSFKSKTLPEFARNWRNKRDTRSLKCNIGRKQNRPNLVSSSQIREQKAVAMSAIIEKEFDRNLRPRDRNRGFPKVALRQRSADHPMIMFFLVVAAAFTAMTVVPPSGAAFASFGVPAAVSAPALNTMTAGPKNVGLSDTDIACHGQVWGAESAECLAMIARQSGRTDGRTVRVIAGA
jgi:hypothetical protein